MSVMLISKQLIGIKGHQASKSFYMSEHLIQHQDNEPKSPDFIFTVSPDTENYLRSINVEIKGTNLVREGGSVDPESGPGEEGFSIDLVDFSSGNKVIRLEKMKDSDNLNLISIDEEGNEVSIGLDLSQEYPDIIIR